MPTIDPTAPRESTHRRYMANGRKNDEILSHWGRQWVRWGRGNVARAKAAEARAVRRATRQALRRSM
jgi:hypothetical protein